MSKVHIVTDSAAVIDPEVVDRFQITVVPLQVEIDDEVYQDGDNLGHEELLLRMARKRTHPEVVGPTVQDFQQVYSRLTRRTDQIISIHSSGTLSLVCNQARMAARYFLGRRDIAVIDSETLSLGLGILVEKAAQMAEKEIPMDDIIRHVRGMLRHIYISLTTDTLDYLQYSNRISASQAILGTMLDNKPYLAMEGGEIIPMEKVIGRDDALDKLADFANEFPHIEQMAILQSVAYPTEDTKALQEDLNAIKKGQEVPLLLYGPVLASHIGPDGIGLVVYEGYKEGRRRI